MSEEPQATPLRLNAQPSQDGGPAGPSQGTPSPASQSEADKSADAPLRLKLRPRAPTPEIPAAPAPATPAAPGSAPAESGPAKVRLKPRLTAEPESKAEETAAAQPAAKPAAEPVPILFKTDEPPAPPATIPPSPEPVAAEPSQEPPSPPPPIPFKPKLKVPGAETPEAPTAPTEAPAPETPAVEKVVPPFLVVPTSQSTARTSSNPPFVVGSPKVPHIKGPEGQVEMPEPPPKVEPAKRTVFKVGVAIAVTAGLIIVGVGGYALMKALTPKPTPPKPVATIKRPAPAKPAAPGAAKPATLPSSVGQVQALISATQKAEQARVDALATGQSPPDTSAAQSGIQWAPTQPSAAQSKPAATTPPSPAPAVVAQPPPPPVEVVRVAAPPQASAAFRRFVANASIPGVFQGTPARALINGRTVQAGELADRNLGIIFLRIDAEKKTITFKDGTGAEVTRSY